MRIIYIRPERIQLYREILIGLLILAASTLTCKLGAQNGDDPFLDQPQKSLWNKNILPLGALQTSTVITVENWDNFNLGEDFAENNMTENPKVPGWYFTAYNTNSAHHTENGLDWESITPNFGSTMQGNPVSAYDSLGNLFYANLFGTTQILGLKIMKSSDNGVTWGPGITALTGTDKDWIACDQTKGPNANNVYACMTNNGKGNFSRSTDHGLTFTTTFTPSTQDLPGMMVCVGPDNDIQGGSVYVVTNSGNSFASTYTFYRSHDGGQTFSLISSQQFANYVGTDVNGRNSVENMRTRPYPLIAADNSYGPYRGRLYLVYASNDPPGDGNKPDIFTRHSDDAGATWSNATKVNDDINTELNNQWHPAIWCDKQTGHLYVQWMDTRDTPTHDSAFIYASYSDDGGNTFAGNQRISNQKMKINCTTCGGGGTPSYEGDYNGIYSNNKTAMAGWTDFRNGTFMSATAYFPDFAMAIDHVLDTLFTTLDSAQFSITIPEVKLYSDTVILSGNIIPVPSSGTISFLYPSGNRIVSFPNTLPVRVKLTGDVPTGDYQAQFFAQGPNGTPVHQRNATIRVLSGAALYLTATATPASICAGTSSQLHVGVIGGKTPYTFSWTPTTGLNNPGIQNPIASPVVSTRYHVQVVDSNFLSAQDSVLVAIIPTPPDPGGIMGPQVSCQDSTASYSIASIPGATSYSWTIPSDAILLGGQNTTSISVQWGTGGGNLSVIAGNSCGNSNPSVLPVTVLSIPASPASILGPINACKDATLIYSAEPVEDASSYFWTVPADVLILQGQNSDSVTLQWGTNAGDISVIAKNICGESPARTRTINI